MTKPMNDSWIDFYTRFADSLLQYQSDRQTLIQKLKNVFASIGMKFPKVEEDGTVYDLDPFTIYGFFNKGISEQNRKALIQALISEFQIESTVPESFDSLPVVNNLRAAYFCFLKERAEADIDHLWELFHTALAFSENPDENNRAAFIKAYDTVLKQPGIQWNLTMGLYWIRPHTFIALDSKNRWFFLQPEFIPETVRTKLPKLKAAPDARTYLELLQVFNDYTKTPGSAYSSFPEISYAAWIESGRTHPVNIGPTNSLSDSTQPQKRYWVYAPGSDASQWASFYSAGIMALGWDELENFSQYADKSAVRKKLNAEYGAENSMKNAAHAVWQFCHDMHAGDVIFVKKGRTEILGRGVVISESIYDESRESFKNIRKVKWDQNGTWKLDRNLPSKTLTDITSYTETVEKIESLFEQEEETVLPAAKETLLAAYSREDFLQDVYMEPEAYDQLVHVLGRKKNVILQGPPGVGKTFAAKRLAYSMMGVKDPERVAMIQFHQSYAYEDFIMGFRPTQSGFELKKGSFYTFCRMAEEDLENDYFFIIDEINRGNLSKIFGELFMLLENDKRGIPMQLLYADEQFTIPENVYIIGMMNTADRSLAIMDYALRRRFSFFQMHPGFESDGFKDYQESLQDAAFDQLVQSIEALNTEIEQDASLGEGFCIGHSYLCSLQKEDLENSLHDIVEYELIPMLKEYWFDDSQKVHLWADKLRRSIQ